MESNSPARAGTTDRVHAKEELDRRLAHVRRLEAENGHLRRANRLIGTERDQTKRAYRNLISQIAHCPRCLGSVINDNEALPIAPSETETRQNPETLSLKESQVPYRGSILPCGDLTSAASAATNSAVVNLTAQSGSPRSRDLGLLTTSLSTDLFPSDRNEASFFTHVSPILGLRDTQPSSVLSSGHVSPIPTSRRTSSAANGPFQNSSHNRRPDSPAFGPWPSSEHNLLHEGSLTQPVFAHGTAKKVLEEASERNALTATSSQCDYIDYGRRFPSLSPSDASMQSGSESRQEDEVATEVEVEEQDPADSSAPSSFDPDDDSGEVSDGDPATSVDASEESIRDTNFENASKEGSKALAIQRRENVVRSSISRNNEECYERGSPTSCRSKGPVERLHNSVRLSAEPHLAVTNLASHKAHLPGANVGFSKSRSLGARRSHSPITVGTQLSTAIRYTTQNWLTEVTPTVSTPAMSRQGCDQPVRTGEEENDTDLKHAIRESYAKFALSGHRLRFCYEPQTLNPFSINLNTNWKRRSKLNESAVQKLVHMAAEISTFVPEADTRKATEKEIDLIRRLCNYNRARTVWGSLREVVGALRRERDVTKDELHLIEFEIYSTLIIMKSQSQSEASHQSFFSLISNELNRSSSTKRWRDLAIINPLCSECTIVYMCSLHS